MATSSEVSTRLSADNSAYKSVMDDTVRVTDRASTAILKKLDIRAGVTAIAAAIGFNLTSISEGIARFAIGWTKSAEDQLNKLVEATDKAADKQEQALARARQKAAKEEDARADAATRSYEVAHNFRMKLLDEEAKSRRAAAQGAYDLQQKADEAHRSHVEDNLELLTLEAKAKRGLTEEEAKRLKTLREQSTELDRQEQITSLLSLNKRSPEEEATLQKLIQQSAAYREMIPLVKELASETVKRRDAEEAAARAKWAGNIDVRGRADSQLSDTELEQKIRNLEQDIFQRQQALRGPGWLGPGQPYDPILSSMQQPALAAALAAQRARAEVRRNADFFGESRARQMFNGSDQEFTAALAGFVSKQDRFISVLEKLEKSTQAIPEALKAIPRSST